MANLLVDERDVKFVLYEQLNIEELCQSEKYGEFSREMFDMVLDAAQKLAEKELCSYQPRRRRQGRCPGERASEGP